MSASYTKATQASQITVAVDDAAINAILGNTDWSPIFRLHQLFDRHPELVPNPRAQLLALYVVGRMGWKKGRAKPVRVSYPALVKRLGLSGKHARQTVRYLVRSLRYGPVPILDVVTGHKAPGAKTGTATVFTLVEDVTAQRKKLTAQGAKALKTRRNTWGDNAKRDLLTRNLPATDRHAALGKLERKLTYNLPPLVTETPPAPSQSAPSTQPPPRRQEVPSLSDARLQRAQEALRLRHAAEDAFWKKLDR